MNEQREGNEWQKVGAPCVYHYKGPHGFALQPERFKAVVLGFTTRGRIRIKAFDHVSGEWFDATVRRASLFPRGD
jgi:hypothetical protein